VHSFFLRTLLTSLFTIFLYLLRAVDGLTVETTQLIVSKGPLAGQQSFRNPLFSPITDRRGPLYLSSNFSVLNIFLGLHGFFSVLFYFSLCFLFLLDLNPIALIWRRPLM